jgi:hypothetical protein
LVWKYYGCNDIVESRDNRVPTDPSTVREPVCKWRRSLLLVDQFPSHLTADTINSTYLDDDAAEGRCEVSLFALSVRVKGAADDWGGFHGAFVVGSHVRCIRFLPSIILFMGGVRYTRDTGVGLIPATIR